jgi:hypothetical protein
MAGRHGAVRHQLRAIHDSLLTGARAHTHPKEHALQVNPSLSATRNQARQKLAKFGAREFASFIIDLLMETKRRHAAFYSGQMTIEEDRPQSTAMKPAVGLQNAFSDSGLAKSHRDESNGEQGAVQKACARAQFAMHMHNFSNFLNKNSENCACAWQIVHVHTPFEPLPAVRQTQNHKAYSNLISNTT